MKLDEERRYNKILDRDSSRRKREKMIRQLKERKRRKISRKELSPNPENLCDIDNIKKLNLIFTILTVYTLLLKVNNLSNSLL